MSRFSAERDILIQLVQDSNIETETNSRKKQNIQNEITSKYNNYVEFSACATPAMLSKAWSNFKTRAKAKRAQFIKDQKATGGGPPPGKLIKVIMT